MRPCLRNAVVVTIEVLDRSGTVEDSLADEPYHPVSRSSTVEVRAQVEELAANTREAGPGGSDVPAVALVTFRRKDLLALGYTPQDGDRLTTIAPRKGPAASRSVSWYLLGPRGLGHGARGLNELVQVRCVNKPPSRDQNDGIAL